MSTFNGDDWESVCLATEADRLKGSLAACEIALAACQHVAVSQYPGLVVAVHRMLRALDAMEEAESRRQLLPPGKERESTARWQGIWGTAFDKWRSRVEALS